uniref:Uncharacterized protein n=1 Tax=viral metagenome TaxID=1070528 RepID=A0A6C0HJM8_9ZZZZ
MKLEDEENYTKVIFDGYADLKYVVTHNNKIYQVDDLYKCQSEAKGGKYRKKTKRRKCRKSKQKDSRTSKRRRSSTKYR